MAGGARSVSIPRSSAVHEAGHAIAGRRYGFGFESVHVAERGSSLIDGAGRKVGGFCRGLEWFTDLDIWPHISEAHENYRIDARERAFRCAVVYLAGSDAEARQSKRSALSSALTGGRHDLVLVGRIAKFIATSKEDEKKFSRATETESRRFVRDPVMWAAINALADLLQARGKGEADEPDVIAITEPIERLADLEIPGVGSELDLYEAFRATSLKLAG